MATFIKPPGKIIVGNEVFTVRVVRNVDTADGSEAWGRLVYDSRAISLCRAMSPGKALEIMFHELAHAWLWVYRDPSKPFREESVVHCTGRALSDLLIHNPELVLWINKTLKQARIK